MTDELVVRRNGPLATVLINRPDQRNAISYSMWLGFPRLFEELSTDDSVRVVVLAGAGDRAFSAGADIKDFEETRSTPERASRYREAVNGACEALGNLNKPTIASIRGYCLGGGFELALYADIRVSASDGQFGLPAAKRGIAVSHGHLDRLMRIAGPGHTGYLMMSGRNISAETALAAGLVSMVVDPESLLDETTVLATEIAELSPVSHRFHKSVIRDLLEFGTASQVPKDKLSASESTEASDDFLEGVRAFKERRKPEFTGH